MSGTIDCLRPGKNTLPEPLNFQNNKSAKTVSVAPMMEWTDRHCRYFHRLISPHTHLYTEMVHAQAVIHNPERLLRFDPAEKPVTLQLGGSVPQDLARAAAIGADFGYDQINLNCGCPSPRVQEGRFGACLMAEPELVAECVQAMRQALPVSVPVTVKCRIGLNRQESFDFLDGFVRTLAQAGCQTFVIHARSAILDKNFTPKENREIPPLRYDLAARIKADHPELRIVLNGGIKTPAEIRAHLDSFDGVMVGREAYHNPWMLAGVESEIFGGTPWDRQTVARAMIPYIEAEMVNHAMPPHAALRHMLGLYAGQPGARQWRRILGEGDDGAAPSLRIEQALAAVTAVAEYSRTAQAA